MAVTKLSDSSYTCQEKNSSVARDVSALHNAMENDRASRQEREASLAKRLADIEYRTEGISAYFFVKEGPHYC